MTEAWDGGLGTCVTVLGTRVLQGPGVPCSNRQSGPLVYGWVLLTQPWYHTGPSDIGEAGSVQDRACSRRGREGWACNRLSPASGHGLPHLSCPRTKHGTQGAPEGANEILIK